MIEPNALICLILKLVIGHDPDPVPCTSYPHNLFAQGAS